GKVAFVDEHFGRRDLRNGASLAHHSQQPLRLTVVAGYIGVLERPAIPFVQSFALVKILGSEARDGAGPVVRQAPWQKGALPFRIWIARGDERIPFTIGCPLAEEIASKRPHDKSGRKRLTRFQHGHRNATFKE